MVLVLRWRRTWLDSRAGSICPICIANGRLAHDGGLRHRDASGLGDHVKRHCELMKGFTQQTIKTTFTFPKATLATRFIMNWKEVWDEAMGAPTRAGTGARGGWVRLKEHFEVSWSEVSNRLHMHGDGDIYTHFPQNGNLILRIQTCGTLAASVLKLTMARVSV